MKPLEPVEADFFTSAPHRFTNTAYVAAPREAVFTAIAADPAGWGRWFPGFDMSGRYLSPPPYGVGSVRQVRAFFADYRETVLVWEAGERWAFRVDAMTRPMFRAFAEDYRLADQGAGTRLTWTVALRAGRALDLAGPIMPSVFGLMLRRVAAGLGREASASH
jgi:carbon monoxide dehydrogenase subunit G